MRSIHSHTLQDIRSQHYCHLYVVTEKGHTVSKMSQFDFRVLRFRVITYRWQAHIVKAYYYAERIESLTKIIHLFSCFNELGHSTIESMVPNLASPERNDLNLSIVCRFTENQFAAVYVFMCAKVAIEISSGCTLTVISICRAYTKPICPSWTAIKSKGFEIWQLGDNAEMMRIRLTVRRQIW